MKYIGKESDLICKKNFTSMTQFTDHITIVNVERICICHGIKKGFNPHENKTILEVNYEKF